MPAAEFPVFAIGPFALLFLSIPVLLAGEQLTKRVGWLTRSNVPPPIVGGLLVAVLLLAMAEARPGWLVVQGNSGHALWLWSILPQWGLEAPRPTDVERPLLILFFTCIGLNASWAVARQGGKPLAIYLFLASLVALMQAVVGAVVARAIGESPLLGVMAGNVALMGGFGTAAGFAPEFVKAGFSQAATVGVAAAAFGVISGGLIAGIVGGRLAERQLGRKPLVAGGGGDAVVSRPAGAGGFLQECRDLLRGGTPVLVHLLVLLAAMKLGAFVSLYIQQAGITFPVYMGSMIVAAIFRNLHDALRGEWLRSEQTDAIGSVALAWLLTVVMIDLQLSQLAHAALPMLITLSVQVILLAALSYWVVFRVMGRDYEAAMMSAGMIGFGLGAMSNALASMRVLAGRFGAAPRAFLIVPIVGVFLVDFINALITTTALNFLR